MRLSAYNHDFCVPNPKRICTSISTLHYHIHSVLILQLNHHCVSINTLQLLIRLLANTYLTKQRPETRDQIPDTRYKIPDTMSSSSMSSRRKTSNFVVQKNQISSSIGPKMHVEFPVSPQLMYGEEMVHFSHTRHGPLLRICLPDLFRCSGCKEHGAGNRFSCQQCDFQLHDFCALSPPVLKAHPFHFHHHLLFYSTTSTNSNSSNSTTSSRSNNKCHICGNPIKGFSFRCGVCCSFQMHPCCAMLSTEINAPSLHPHELRMLPPPAAAASVVAAACGECKRTAKWASGSGGRVYRCSVCEYHVHAACVKKVKNGLTENGHNNQKASSAGGGSSVLGTAARVASQVVVEFLGGIIEGIGEGVGEAFVQNINAKAAPSPSPPLHHRRC